MEKIDFVVTWVDDHDPAWRALYNQYRPEKPLSDAARFREWNLFRYWFRAVERYAPWVNKVFLITNGTFPEWINEECPKLVLVRHEDYIPHEYLPTFNANTIELNLHRIEGLSPYFVYFNDDMYLNNPVSPEHFFKNGLPCDYNGEKKTWIPSYDPQDRYGIQLSIYCDMALVNHHFNHRQTVSQAPWKWYGPHLALKDFWTALILSHTKKFRAFRWRHFEQPLLKSVLADIWEAEPQLMANSCTRFREDLNLTDYVIRYWQFATNQFHPARRKGVCYHLNGNNTEAVVKALQTGKFKSVCINDTPKCSDEAFHAIQLRFQQVFQEKFPDKSMFEK